MEEIDLHEALQKHKPFIEGSLTERYLKLVSAPYRGKGARHHILPKSVWPQYDKSKWNIVNLSHENHLLAHQLLPKICVCKKAQEQMIHALMFMVTLNNAGTLSEMSYQDLQYAKNEIQSRSVSGKNNPMYGVRLVGNLNPMFGKTHGSYAREMASFANRGRVHDEEFRKALSVANAGEKNSMYGKTHTPEARAKISNALTGRKMASSDVLWLHFINSGEGNPMYGRKQSDITKQRMSDAKASIEFEGAMYSLSSLCRKFGVERGTISDRLKRGMTLHEALSKPIRFRTKKVK